MTDLDGLVAVVTGGASGIGAATARLLSTRGAQVAVLDRALDGAPDGLLAVPCDITDTETRSTRRSRSSSAELGGLDVLVNNAGIGAIGDVSQNDDAEWARVLDVNVTGMARVSRAALPHLRRSAHPVDRQHVLRRAFVGSGNVPSTAPARGPCSRSPWPWRPTTSLRGSG